MGEEDKIVTTQPVSLHPDSCSQSLSRPHFEADADANTQTSADDMYPTKQLEASGAQPQRQEWEDDYENTRQCCCDCSWCTGCIQFCCDWVWMW